MSKEKQIEELAQHLWAADENHETFDIRGNYHDLAEALYNAGYRKQSEQFRQMYDNTRNLLLHLKREVHEKAVYPSVQGIDPYISLKVFDALINKLIGS